MRIRTEKDKGQVFAAILQHPMENGRRKDRRTGRRIPAHYIEDFSVSVDGEKYIDIRLGENIATNPLVSFVMSRPVTSGQKLQLSWIDNHGVRVFHRIVVRFNADGVFRFSGAPAPTDRDGADGSET